jgi:hemolysin activation/secretion protein
MRLPIAIILSTMPGLAFSQNVGTRADMLVTDPKDFQPLPVESNEYRLPTLLTPQAESAPLRLGGELFVKHVRVEGVTALNPDALAAAIRPYENRMVSSAELQSLRVALTRLYVDNGYVNSGVLLPDQEIKDGVVVYRAIEGSLTRVELVGAPKLRPRYVSSRIQRKVDDPLNVSDLQYALRYLEEDPNIRRLDAALAPGDQLGESVLRLRIDDEPRFSAGLSADNHRSSSTGAEQASLIFATRNLVGLGDELQASIGLSEGANESSMLLTVPFLARNDLVQLHYSKSDADIIEKDFRALDITSESESMGIRFQHPFVDELDTQLGASLGFETNRSVTELLGQRFSFSPGAQNGESKTSVASLGFNWLLRTPASVSALSVNYRRGIDTLDATIDRNLPPDPFEPNPTGADGRFSNIQLQATYIQRLNSMPRAEVLDDRAQFVFRVASQISQDPLLSVEKFPIGGVNTVRGYPENLLVRDNGIAATLEVQFPVFHYRSTPHPLNLVFTPFIDFGRSWDDKDTDPGDPDRDTDEPRYIMSLGIGALWQPLRGLSAQVYWGMDFGNNFEGDDPRDFREEHDLQDEGVHFSLSYVARW